MYVADPNGPRAIDGDSLRILHAAACYRIEQQRAAAIHFANAARGVISQPDIVVLVSSDARCIIAIAIVGPGGVKAARRAPRYGQRALTPPLFLGTFSQR